MLALPLVERRLLLLIHLDVQGLCHHGRHAARRVEQIFEVADQRVLEQQRPAGHILQRHRPPQALLRTDRAVYHRVRPPAGPARQGLIGGKGTAQRHVVALLGADRYQQAVPGGDPGEQVQAALQDRPDLPAQRALGLGTGEREDQQGTPGLCGSVDDQRDSRLPCWHPFRRNLLVAQARFPPGHPLASLRALPLRVTQVLGLLRHLVGTVSPLSPPSAR